jgi:hypothetical protein
MEVVNRYMANPSEYFACEIGYITPDQTAKSLRKYYKNIIAICPTHVVFVQYECIKWDYKWVKDVWDE